jgi:hypothetical protein
VACGRGALVGIRVGAARTRGRVLFRILAVAVGKRVPPGFSSVQTAVAAGRRPVWRISAVGSSACVCRTDGVDLGP